MTDLGMSLREVADVVSGRLSRETDVAIERVSIDTRKDVSGALYVALRGARFDGHDFAAEAVEKGAAAALVERVLEGIAVPQIEVADSLAALGALAARRRRDFEGKVIAVTGSSGKTSTRKMIAAILATRGPVHQPVRNFNNQVGVPLTLLDIEPEHWAAVLELGCSDFNEIGPLTRVVRPDVALITNVGPAHLERLGSLAGVAKAKGELFLELEPGAVAVVNGDDPFIREMTLATSHKILFGTAAQTDVALVERRPVDDGQIVNLSIGEARVEFKLPLSGAHNARNALAAAAVAKALGIDNEAIAEGLESATTEAGRFTVMEGAAGTVIVNDAYNANPASVRAALEAVSEMAVAGRKWAVLGDMLELGEHSRPEHEKLGELLTELGLDRLVTVGEGGASIQRGAAAAGFPGDARFHVSDNAAAAELLLEAVRTGDLVLVKGSRGMHMEDIVEVLGKGAL